jgi:Uma2 family endonuclease
LVPIAARISYDRAGGVQMAEPQLEPWTLRDFLLWERAQPERYEFVDGLIVGMTGGTAAHATIKGNVFSSLRAQLRGKPCRAFTDSLKVVTEEASHYPDVAVTCSPVAPTDEELPDPVVIVEVLSRTTSDRDRGAKWVNYRTLTSLQHYVLVASHRHRVEVISRIERGWTLFIVEPPEHRLELPAIGAELALDEIYQDSGV